MFKKPLRLINKFKHECIIQKGEGCKPVTRQLAEVIQLLLRAQLTPGEYFFHRFFETDKDYSYMLNYISNYHLITKYRPVLNNQDWVQLLENKVMFNHYYGRLGQPVTKIYGYYHPQYGITADGLPLTNREELIKLLFQHKLSSFVLKPVRGIEGFNILVVKKTIYNDEGTYFITAADTEIGIPDIMSHLNSNANLITEQGYLFEAKVEQHAMIRRFNKSSLNTVRVITLLGRDDKPYILYAALRVGRTGSSVDNFGMGGIFIALNLNNGTLGKGIFGKRIRSNFIIEHPDTKISFTGQKIPYWEEVKQLCLNAASSTPFLRSIGWDVAITPQGPLLLEGNDNHGVRFQALYDGYLQPDVRKKLEKYGLVFPGITLPGYHLKTIVEAIRIWAG